MDMKYQFKYDDKVLNSAAALQKKFGLSSQEALDFIVTGFQKGLNNSDDFLDSIGEYANLFAEGNVTADQIFSLMETGISGGVLGTDKMADDLMTLREADILTSNGANDPAE